MSHPWTQRSAKDPEPEASRVISSRATLVSGRFRTLGPAARAKNQASESVQDSMARFGASYRTRDGIGTDTTNSRAPEASLSVAEIAWLRPVGRDDLDVAHVANLDR